MTDAELATFIPLYGDRMAVSGFCRDKKGASKKDKKKKSSLMDKLRSTVNAIKAILQVLIYKALYDKSYLESKTTMTTGEWSCLISFTWAPLTCSERGGSEKFKMKIYVPAGFEPAPRQSMTGKSERLRPLGHAG